MDVVGSLALAPPYPTWQIGFQYLTVVSRLISIELFTCIIPFEAYLFDSFHVQIFSPLQGLFNLILSGI
jgi:hypothetical protein